MLSSMVGPRLTSGQWTVAKYGDMTRVSWGVVNLLSDFSPLALTVESESVFKIL